MTGRQTDRQNARQFMHSGRRIAGLRVRADVAWCRWAYFAVGFPMLGRGYTPFYLIVGPFGVSISRWLT